jgi:hypothetical protein
MKALVLDIDDTVAQLGPVIAPELCKLSGRNVHHSDWWTSDWTEMYGVDGHQVREFLGDRRFNLYRYLAPTCEYWARLVTQATINHIAVIVVTARNRMFPEGSVDLTYEWLKSIGVPIPKPHILTCVRSHEKAETFAALGYEPVMIVDDLPQVCDSFVERWPSCKPLVFATPFNYTTKHLRVHNSIEVYNVFTSALHAARFRRA